MAPDMSMPKPIGSMAAGSSGSEYSIGGFEREVQSRNSSPAPSPGAALEAASAAPASGDRLPSADGSSLPQAAIPTPSPSKATMLSPSPRRIALPLHSPVV